MNEDTKRSLAKRLLALPHNLDPEIVTLLESGDALPRGGWFDPLGIADDKLLSDLYQKYQASEDPIYLAAYMCLYRITTPREMTKLEQIINDLEKR